MTSSTTADEGAHRAPSSRTPEPGDQPEPPLQLADGLELIGLFEGSGYEEPPYIARRADGQVLQLSQLLYLTAEAVESEDSLQACADRVSEGFGRTVSADNVRTLVEDKLRPLGVVVDADGNSPEVRKNDPLLALTYRAGLVDEGVVRRLSRPFQPLFRPIVMGVVLAALLAVDVYVFGVIGIGDGLREALYEPAILLGMLALVVLSAAFHEFGHAAATAAGGASPGKMGAGLYLVWPVFYTDVTDAYRLTRGQRVIVDLGGVYFNALVVLATFALYLGTRWEPLLLLILIQHLEMLHQFLPFVRLDGYYVVADATGVPDLFPRIKPILTSLLPGRDTPASVAELKPWVRVAVSTWVLLVVPVLLVNLALMAFYFPRILATTWDSMLIQVDAVTTGLPQGDVVGVAAAVVQGLVLLLPVVGIPLIFIRLGRRVTKAVHSRIADAEWDLDVPTPGRRAGASAVALAAIALVAFVAWPNGDYRPLQPGEQLTTAELAGSFRAATTGRPGLSEAREAELGEVRSERDRRRDEAGGTGADGEGAVEPAAEPAASETPSASPTPTSRPTPTPADRPTTPSGGSASSGGTSSGSASSGGTSSGSASSGSTSSGGTSSGGTATTPTSGPTPTPTPTPTLTATPTSTDGPQPATRPTSAP